MEILSLIIAQSSYGMGQYVGIGVIVVAIVGFLIWQKIKK